MRGHARLLAVTLGALASIALSGCHSPCSGRTALQDRAGADAVDCGDLLVGEDRTAAVTCAREAHSAGEAFVVRFRYAGKDSAVASSFGFDGAGRQWRADEDWFPCESSGNTETCNPTVRVFECASLSFTDQNINCVEPGPAEEDVCG